LKGALYAQIQIGYSKLHLYTTHAQATYDNTLQYFLKRTEQFRCFQKFIDRSLAANRYREGEAVVLTGDFNVDSRDTQKFKSSKMMQFSDIRQMKSLNEVECFGEYDALLTCLNGDNKNEIENVLFESHGQHPITFGDYEVTKDNKKKPTETVLTDEKCLLVAECLDYIFRYVPTALLENELRQPCSYVKERLSIVPGSAEVEKFLVKNRHFTQLSDHYGVKVTLQYTETVYNDEDCDTVSQSTDDSTGSPMKSIRSE